MSVFHSKDRIPILIAEDDPDDRLLLEEAFQAFKNKCELYFVEDGEILMEYLHHLGRYTDLRSSPRPGLILLDLNMPKKDGRQALLEIKNDPRLKEIPLIIWTTSSLKEDNVRCREAGADEYLTKPSSFAELDETIRRLMWVWLRLSSSSQIDELNFTPHRTLH